MRASHRASVHRAAPWLALLCAAALTACGYAQDVQTLPQAAQSIGLGRVDNHTDAGELDVRLRAELERRLAGLARVRLLPPARSALRLDIDLTALSISRTLDPALTASRTLSYRLSGLITLTDQRSGRILIDREPLGSSIGRQFEPGVRETPALRDEGLNDVLAGFAEQVQQRLFISF